MKKVRLGKKPPLYRFFLNPHADIKCTTCPQCSQKTRQRKLPLVINIDPPLNILVLIKTCRYCPHDDLLIANKAGLDPLLTAVLTEHLPELVGHEYLVLGTLDNEGKTQAKQQLLDSHSVVDELHDFKEVIIFRRWGT